MSSTSLQLNITKQCTENWQGMTSLEQGVYCNSCSKVVIDFSSMTDNEVVTYFQKRKEENICGRLRKDQLNKQLVSISVGSIKYEYSTLEKFLAALFICFSGLLTGCENNSSTFRDIPIPENVVINKKTTTLTENFPDSSASINEKFTYIPGSGDSIDLNYTFGFVTVEPKFQSTIVAPQIVK